ncbi:Hypothetical protein NTJ_09170 [Nesidiocoris tenuis]|uniref:Uncharacterized protein n=1 Tax=Nesidiocoris tenuis TaxID=355587 RepID=A0ABN7AYF7_9HEMI|nr:Hypothetical protein NTJ_09170 [Nesidiocoris tenuis]
MFYPLFTFGEIRPESAVNSEKLIRARSGKGNRITWHSAATTSDTRRRLGPGRGRVTIAHAPQLPNFCPQPPPKESILPPTATFSP